MNDQRQFDPRQQSLLPTPEGPGATGSAERLAAAREGLERIYASADAILDQLDQASNSRFLEQVRQSGGE